MGGVGMAGPQPLLALAPGKGPVLALAPGKGPVLAPGQALDRQRPLPLDPDRGLAAGLGL
jgi:hypothetical protein